MDPETEEQLLERRLEQIAEGAAEAIRREVRWLREHNFPVWVAENGRVVDARKNGSTDTDDFADASRPGAEP